MKPLAAASEQLSFSEIEKLRQDVPGGLLTSLGHREQLFLLYLIRDPALNRVHAAIMAGYPKRGAKQRAYEVLNRPGVKAALDDIIRARGARITVDADRVLREVDTVSLSDVSHYRLTDDGHLELTALAPPDAMKAVKSFKRRTRTIPQKDGPPITVIEAEFVLYDKPAVLRLSMQHRGMLVERHTVDLRNVTDMTDEELEAERQQLGLGVA